MADNNDDMEKQRRHWGLTVQYGHLGIPYKYRHDEITLGTGATMETIEAEFVERMKVWWQVLLEAPGLRYAVGQVERCEKTERLHGQIYTEWIDPIRGRTVVNRYPSSVKARWASRDVCRAYHKKTETRVEVLGEFGEWRDDKVAGEQSPKQRAIQYIVKEGLSAKDIALIDPECYFTHHRSINELIAAMRHINEDGNDDI